MTNIEHSLMTSQRSLACEPIVFLHPENHNMIDAIPYDTYVAKLSELKEQMDMGSDEAMDAYRKMMKRRPYRKYKIYEPIRL